MKKRIYVFMLFIILTTASFAQQITIHVETAGTLSSLIAESKKDVITDLKLTGNLNSHQDLVYIRSMAALEYLDIKDVIIYIGGIDYKSIDSNSFKGMTSLKSIVLPANTVSISYNAFQDCENLISIDFPNTLAKIWTGAFAGCTSLKSIVLPNSVTELGEFQSSQEGCFEQCTSLESIILPEKIKYIPPRFARGCTSLKAITIPDEVTNVGSNAFYDCPNLKDFVVGQKVNMMYGYDYVDSKIENVVFKCQDVGRWFEKCNALKTVTFENTVQSIKDYAFSGCVNIESIHIPNNLSSIAESSFEGCIGMKKITVEEDNLNYSSFNNALFNKSQTTLISFANKSNNNFTIPQTVIAIGKSAFYGCDNLESVTLPASVAEVGSSAFSGCTNLKEIFSYATTPPSAQTATFDDANKRYCTLYVPVGCYTAYWLAPGWGDFANIKEFDPTGVQMIVDSAPNNKSYYSVDGAKRLYPKAGINIIKSYDGTIKKVFIK